MLINRPLKNSRINRVIEKSGHNRYDLILESKEAIFQIFGCDVLSTLDVNLINPCIL